MSEMTPTRSEVAVTPCTLGPEAAPAGTVVAVADPPPFPAGPHTGSVMVPNWPLAGAGSEPRPGAEVALDWPVAVVSFDREHPVTTATNPITKLTATTRRCMDLTGFPLVGRCRGRHPVADLPEVVTLTSQTHSCPPVETQD